MAVAAGIAVGLYYGHGFITTSERFAVQHIEVRGNHAVSSERVIDILGVSPGDNIFQLELDRLAGTLEQREPMIAHARVSRRLPATLLIDVEERRSAALVELDGLYLADARGRVFRRASIARGDGEGLPVITGLSREEYLERPGAIEDQIRRALDAIALYQTPGTPGGGTPERPALGSVDLHPRRGITFTTYDQAVAVRVGGGNQDAMRAKLGAFDAAWRAMSAAERARVRIVYADISDRPDRVTVGFQHPE